MPIVGSLSAELEHYNVVFTRKLRHFIGMRCGLIRLVTAVLNRQSSLNIDDTSYLYVCLDRVSVK